MASVQQAAVQFITEQEKASIAEAVKEAQNHLENNNAKARQDNLALVTGNMRNTSRRGLMLSETHTWTGHFLAEPPKIMTGNDAFVHQGATTQGHLQVIVGSKGAIVYGTFDMMYPGINYLVAWSKPDDSNQPNKVYVEVGNSSKFAKIDWNEIEKKLDASGSHSRSHDSETGASAAAKITSYDGKLALLGVTFGPSDK